MFIKELKITNSRGDSITFGRHFMLYDHVDLSGLKANINYADSTTDGSHYQNTTLDNREFDIPFFIHRDRRSAQWIEEKRNEAYRVFNPATNPLRLDFTTPAGEEYYMNANLEGAPTFPTGREHENILWSDGLVQFSASDPYIYEKNSRTAEIAQWIPMFEFPLEIPEEGFEVGRRSESLIVNVVNDGQHATGMIIRFRALGTLRNPSLLNVNTYEVFKINTEEIPGKSMLAGDVIEVSTYRGKRTVTLIRDNTRTSIFNSFTLESKFLQLEIGDNLFRYDAESGLDNLEVSINYTPRRIGV